MVEFVRDVIVAVAVLTTLIAVAVHSSETEPKRHGSLIGASIAATVAPAITPSKQAGDATRPK